MKKKTEKIFECPVKDGDSVVLICSNGTQIELWNSRFGLDYTIKLVKNPKKSNKKEISIFCEKCGKEYIKADADHSIEGEQFTGGYCDKCSKEYQIKKYGRIIEK